MITFPLLDAFNEFSELHMPWHGRECHFQPTPPPQISASREAFPLAESHSLSPLSGKILLSIDLIQTSVTV